MRISKVEHLIFYSIKQVELNQNVIVIDLFLHLTVHIIKKNIHTLSEMTVPIRNYENVC